MECLLGIVVVLCLSQVSASFSTTAVPQICPGRIDFTEDNSTCICENGYTNAPNCQMCPGEDESCHEADCCFPPEKLRCVKHSENHSTCVCDSHCNESFIMVAQVALGAALAIAFVALIALFWKTCPRGNPRGRLSALLRERENSLTSIQRFVLQKLRDRPPRYEDNNHIRLEKPPPYEDAAGTNMQIPQAWLGSPQVTEADRQIQEEASALPQSSSSATDNYTYSISEEEQQGANARFGTDNVVFTLADENIQTEQRTEQSIRISSVAVHNAVLTLRDEEAQMGVEHHI